MKYLIVKIHELGDQFECDADRTPYKVVEDWRKEKPKGLYEVYEIQKNGFLTLIRKYTTVEESGMALYFFNEEDDWETVVPTIIYKYPGLNRHNKMPKQVRQYVRNFEQVDDDNNLTCCGTISYDMDGKHFVYGEYFDDRYIIGY